MPELGDNGDNATAARFTRRALLGAAALTVMGWVVVLLVWHDGVFAFTFDDAFYYFGIARNIAAGHGSTFDRLNDTNGYHPLWMALSVVPFAFGLDDMGAARALLVFQLVVGWGGALVISATLVSRFVAGWSRATRTPLPTAARRGASLTLAAVFLLLIANPFIMKAFVNGLESGIAVALYALLLLVAVRSPADPDRAQGWIDRSSRWHLGVSGLLALLFLARTDAVILLGCLGLWCLAEGVTLVRARAAGAARVSGPHVARALVELFTLPAVVLVGYLLANNAAFGTPVQISGLVKRAPLDAAALAILSVLVLAAGALGRHTFRRAHGRKASRSARFPLAGAFVVQSGWYAAFCVLVVGYYNVAQTQQWLWYYCPILLYLVVLMTLAVADIIGVALAGAPAGRAAGRTLAPVLAIFGLPLLLGFGYELSLFTDPTLLSIQVANRDAGAWLRANTPEDAVFASWDAGVVGYFSHRQVINIDGVVNSKAYYEAMRHGTVPVFLRCEHLGFVVNHGTDVGGNDPDIVKLITDVYGADAARDAQVIERLPFTYSGTSNTGGFEPSGPHELVVHVYQMPGGATGPRPGDDCTVTR